MITLILCYGNITCIKKIIKSFYNNKKCHHYHKFKFNTRMYPNEIEEKKSVINVEKRVFMRKDGNFHSFENYDKFLNVIDI